MQRRDHLNKEIPEKLQIIKRKWQTKIRVFIESRLCFGKTNSTGISWGFQCHAELLLQLTSLLGMSSPWITSNAPPIRCASDSCRMRKTRCVEKGRGKGAPQKPLDFRQLFIYLFSLFCLKQLFFAQATLGEAWSWWTWKPEYVSTGLQKMMVAIMMLLMITTKMVIVDIWSMTSNLAAMKAPTMVRITNQNAKFRKASFGWWTRITGYLCELYVRRSSR